jgi:hypothetical protein
LYPQEDLGVGGIKAYHGSPYDFDRFDMSKIGTGEGAQAYGHGLYFAESEPVAWTYRYLNAPVGQGTGAASFARQAESAASNAGLTGDEARTYAIDLLNKKAMEQHPTARQTWYDAANNYDALIGAKEPPGRMYEARINADPEHFLDWDKPLSEQSPQVQQALSANPRVAEAIKYSDNPNNPTGRQIHNAMVSIAARKGGNGDVIASEALRDAGLPGIRYLDAGSRNAPNLTIIPPQQSYAGRWTVQDPVFRGQSKHFDTEADAQAYVAKQSPPATRNTVIFDPATIEILRKYGIAGLMAGGAGAVATQKPSQ